MSDYDPGAARISDIVEISARLSRIEKAIDTMAWWLVAAQTGFGQVDARGISDILSGKRDGEKHTSGERSA